MNETQPTPTPVDKTPQVNPGNYSPVTVYMEDSIGAIFLGILAVILLIRLEARRNALSQVNKSSGGNY